MKEFNEAMFDSKNLIGDENDRVNLLDKWGKERNTLSLGEARLAVDFGLAYIETTCDIVLLGVA